MPLPISVWADEQAGEPSKEAAGQAQREFHKQLDQVLSIASGKLTRTSRRTSAITDESVTMVAKDEVVQVFDTEAHAKRSCCEKLWWLVEPKSAKKNRTRRRHFRSHGWRSRGE